MFLAVLGDVHGNLPALDAVLDAIDERGILTILNTGDAVVGYPWPNEVVDRLREHAVVSVQGEMDRLTVRVSRKAASLQRRMGDEAYRALQWTHDHLRSRTIEYLRDLPLQRTMRIEGIDICLFHGLPTKQADSLHEDDDVMHFQRVRESVHVPLVICGKSHEAFARKVDDTLFVNPGSVGIAQEESGLARYAVINTEVQPWEVELVSTPYDGERAEKAMRERGLPDPAAYLV